MPTIEIGAKAPAFTLKDQHDKSHRLSDYAGRAVVLYFYPKDDTDGCTKEACGFQESLPDFSKVDAVILGVSPDPVASHAKFAKKHALTFTLLADEPAAEGKAPAVCEKFGVWQEKSMYGRKYMGVVRTTYLIGTDGKVAKRWDKVSVPGHAAEVLNAVMAVNGARGTSETGAKKAAKKVAKKAAAKRAR